MRGIHRVWAGVLFWVAGVGVLVALIAAESQGGRIVLHDVPGRPPDTNVVAPSWSPIVDDEGRVLNVPACLRHHQGGSVCVEDAWVDAPTWVPQG